MALFTTILGSAFLAAVANAIVASVVSFAISSLAQALIKKPKAETSSLDFEQTVQRRLRNGQPLEVLTGRRVVAGVGFFDDAYSDKNERGVSVSVVSAKACTQFHRLFLDGEPVELSGDPTTGERSVTSHFLGRNDARRVNVRVFTGQGGNVGLGLYLSNKFPSRYTAADNHGDYCVVVVQCHNTNDDLDEETGTNYIPFQGFPEYKVEMSGVEVCDPRIEGASYDDESTYVYSDNAALIDAQYDYGWYSGVGAGRALIVGNGYPVELMDMDQIEANATYCDTEGFGCSGVIRSAQSGDQEEIWKCYNADRVEHAASVFSVPEGNRELSETIDMSLYPASFVSNYDPDGYSTEVYNEVRTVYSEPAEFFAEKDLPIYSRPEWIAADNHIPRQLALPLLYVTDMVQAGKLEKQEINISRTPSTCNIADLPFGFIRLRIGTLVIIENSDVPAINGRVWIIKGRGQTSRGDVSLSLREYAGTVAFDFDPDTETPEPIINLPIPRPWEEWWVPSDYVPPNVIVRIDGIYDGTAELIDVNLAGRGSLNIDNDARDENINNALSIATTAGGGTMTISRSPSQAAGFDGDGGTGSITTNSVTVSQSGGTAPITYAWVKLSGDAIIVDSSSSAATTFSGDPGVEGTISATFKCTVTDSSATPQVQTVTVGASVTRSDEGGFL